ncbi:hypothetical protein [Variovorax paradoxus]|uniref:hypothetical protein n=1 Tax=Variovorax paradoxus TaxID=34073 RepID=UPI00193234AE|nr:hypothetical protein INQ48_33035 [Variovorax paradoxus]
MTTQRTLSIVLSIFGFIGLAKAETYEGVTHIRSERPRAAVSAEARTAARSPDAGEASYAVHSAVRVHQSSRADVMRSTAEAARAGNPYGDHAGAGVLSLRDGKWTHDAMPAQAMTSTPRAGGSSKQ